MSRVSLETLLSRSNRNMAEGTHPVVRESALEVIKRAYKEGINVQISEGHRSNARQNALYAQGRTKSGNIVTNARAGYSWHNYGIAVDYFLTTKDGNKALWNVNSDWRRVAQIAKSLGFEWGGDWTGFVDYPHLQMTGGLTMAQMRAGRKPNLVSRVDKPVTPQSKPSKPSLSKSVTQMAQEVIDGKHGNGHANRQKSLGVNNATYQKVRAEVNRRAGVSKPSPKPNKSISQMATEVIAGNHGSGHANRRKSLGVNASTYAAVRQEVNKRAGIGTTPKQSINQMATRILTSKGVPNGHAARRKWLGVDNATYQKVRAEVNRRLR